MAGHSKWANIKHKKARADAKRGKVFSKVTKEIISAVKQAGPDPKSNTKLRLALQKAKSVNLPQDNIDRNIKKASSDHSDDYQEVCYELYGAGGVGILCIGMTDNKNRSASEMRIICNKTQATLAQSGSVAFNFDRSGVIRIARSQAIEEELFAEALEAGAIDFRLEDDEYLIITAPEELHSVYEKLNQPSASYEIEFLPKVQVECSQEDAESNMQIFERLDDLEDIDDVFHTMA